MSRSAAERPRTSSRGRTEQGEGDWSRTVALVLIAVVLVLGASAWMSWLIVPLVFAIVLAVALRPLADRLERLGLGRVLASVICVVLLAVGLLSVAVLLTAQAGEVIRNSDRYVERLSTLAAESSGPIEESSLLKNVVEAHEEDDEASGSDEGGGEGQRDEDASSPQNDAGVLLLGEDEEDSASNLEAPGAPSVLDEDGDENRSEASEPEEDLGSTDYWRERIVQNADMIFGWIVRGVGGMLGLLGQLVVLLFLVLYILNSRAVWSDRINQATDALGMKLNRDDMDTMGTLIAQWTWGILALSLGYGILIAAAGAVLGLPQWPLWGILTGILVLIPFFGPLIAAIMLVAVAAIAGQSWGLPLAILGFFVVLQLIEGYLIQPKLYGRTVSFDSLTVLLGVLLFGFLWGPLGFIAALPVLVLIRGFVEAIPGTEAVAALLGDDV